MRVLAATGARRGEVCGLRWSDIDRSESTLTIKRSVASVAGGTVVKDTKTHAARRIAVDADTLAVLDQQRCRMEERAAACRIAFDPDGSFSRRGRRLQPLHPDTITGTFRRICDRAGLSGVRLHDLRHLHATQLLAAACRSAPSAVASATRTPPPRSTCTPTSSRPATAKQPT